MPMLLAKFSPLKYGPNRMTCTICETAMGYVTSLLQEEDTETEVEQLLDKACNFLPKILRTKVHADMIDICSLVSNVIVLQSVKQV